MNKLHSNSIILFFFIVFLLLSVLSCSLREERGQSVLANADSLMMTKPQAALDTLLTLDSSSVAALRSRDRAYYTLLMTEARYKSWRPVAGDTAIFNAADYYRRKGPDDMYARASMMCGAVAQENENPVQALISYKYAEPVLQQSGDIEQLGLLHTRIGELYTLSFVNNKEAADRYRKALTCFQMCGREDREMLTHLSLARVVISESIDTSYVHTAHAIALARKLKDKTALISAYELMTHICRLRKDYHDVISFSKVALSELTDTGRGHFLLPILNNIYLEQTLVYAFLDMLDSAETSASHIKWQENAHDTMARHLISCVIAEGRGEWQKAFQHSQLYHAMTDSIENVFEQIHLRNTELLYDRQALDARNNEILRERNLILISFFIALVAVIGIITSLRQRYRKLRDHHANLLASINICNESEIQDICSVLLSDIQDHAAGSELKDSVRSIILDLTGMICEINSAYFKFKGNIRSIKFMSCFDSILKKYFPEKQTYEKIRRLCITLYPGVLEQIERENPTLTQNDLLLIALMGCGFPTGAICAIKGMTIGSLNSQKTRTAKKIGAGIRLSEYVAIKFLKNMSAPIVPANIEYNEKHPQPNSSHADK